MKVGITSLLLVEICNVSKLLPSSQGSPFHWIVEISTLDEMEISTKNKGGRNGQVDKMLKFPIFS